MLAHYLAEDNPLYMVSDVDKDIWDGYSSFPANKSRLMGIKYLPKIVPNRTIDLSDIPTLIAIPKLTTTNVTSISFANDVSLICIPPLDISNVTPAIG